METKEYVLGNWLRGYYHGDFEDIDTAWSYLSKRFLLSYPSEGGRHVGMWVKEKNKYDIEELIMCREDITELNNLNREETLEKCKSAPYSFL